jgi:Ras-related protein Rab-2A
MGLHSGAPPPPGPFSPAYKPSDPP